MTKIPSTTLPLPSPLFNSLTNLLSDNKDTLGTLKFPADFEIATAFILSYRGSEATFNAYRREVERLIQWSWLIADKSILKITRADFEKYLDFCQAPPKKWIGTKNVPRFLIKDGQSVPNPEWRPFVASVSKADFKNGAKAAVENYSLSERAIRELLAIVSSFFN